MTAVIARDAVAADHLVFAWPFPLGAECEVACAEDEQVVMCPAWGVGPRLGPGRHRYHTPEPARPVAAYFVLTAPVEVAYDLTTRFAIPSTGQPVRLRATGSLAVRCADPGMLVAQFVGLPFDRVNEGVLRSVARSVERMLARLLVRRVVLAGTPAAVVDPAMHASILEELAVYNPTAGAVFGLELMRLGHLSIWADDGALSWEQVAREQAARHAHARGYAPAALAPPYAAPGHALHGPGAPSAVGGHAPPAAFAPAPMAPAHHAPGHQAPPGPPVSVVSGEISVGARGRARAVTPPMGVSGGGAPISSGHAAEVSGVIGGPLSAAPVAPIFSGGGVDTTMPWGRPAGVPVTAQPGAAPPASALPRPTDEITLPGVQPVRPSQPAIAAPEPAAEARGSILAIGATPIGATPAVAGVASGEIAPRVASGARVLVPGPTGLMQSATVRQMLHGYYELEIGSTGEVVWVPVSHVVPE